MLMSLKKMTTHGQPRKEKKNKITGYTVKRGTQKIGKRGTKHNQSCVIQQKKKKKTRQ